MSDNMFGIKKPIKKPESDPVEDKLQKLDEVAERSGFTSREPRRRRNHVGLTVPFNTRLKEDEFKRFVAYCDQHNFTYRQAISHLLDVAENVEGE